MLSKRISYFRDGKCLYFRDEILLALDRLKYPREKLVNAEKIYPSLLRYMDDEDIEHFKMLYRHSR